MSLSTLFFLWAAPPAIAQDEPDPVAAELFRQGRDLVKQGNWKEGCDKLDASMKRAPAASTLLNLALCRQQEGRVATAWAMVKQALVLNRDTVGAQRRERLQTSGEEMLAQIEPRLSRLRVVVVPATPEAQVEESGRSLPLDTAVPLDPGQHELVLRVRGRPDTKRLVSLREGETLSIELAVPAETAPSPPAASNAAVEAPKATVPKPETSTPDEESSSIPIWVWITGAAGIAMTGVGIGFGVDSAITAGNLKERCGEDLICDEDPTFDPEPDNARKNRGLGLAIGFGSAGAIAIGAAIVGIAISGKPATQKSVSSLPVVPWVGADHAGVAISGRF
ncbi:MAG: hypothetical protein HOW73_40100 [Polyangiaceae bacterium]|nr:hypothetical protein [Polyangiaceae bacterium]